jgi:hypothetical protein
MIPSCYCPFYGYALVPDMMKASGGNQCAVITEAYTPCKMELVGETPDMNLCTVVNIRRSYRPNAEVLLLPVSRPDGTIVTLAQHIVRIVVAPLEAVPAEIASDHRPSRVRKRPQCNRSSR